MLIKFECPKCRSKLSAKSDYAGKEGKCKCGAGVIVPGGAERMKFACSQCGKAIRVSKRHAGKKGKCPNCKSAINLPLLGILISVEGKKKSIEPEAVSSGTINFECMMCEAKLQEPKSSAGKIIECPKCGGFAEVPGMQEANEKQEAGAGKDIAEIEAGSRVGETKTSVSCPSCERRLSDNAPVCTQCGIYIKSGRPILTARDVDAGEIEEKAEGTVKAISWLIPIGIYPVYSDVLGNHKPYTTWGITAVTVLVSIWFLVIGFIDSPQMMSAKNLMLWGGDARPTPKRIQILYKYTNNGDAKAFAATKEKLKGTVPDNKLDEATLAALTPEQRCFGEYRHYQLITHALLHAGILHLAGNMLFLLVFGSRVNESIGNILTVILYPILAIIAAIIHLKSIGTEPPTAMLGASGAVMGLAGAYLLLFPVHKVYMVIWIRWGLLAGFHLSYWCFGLRGFLVVLFYIMFDVIAVSLTVESGTAHWAHIGGLLGGIVIAFVLLAGRMAYSRSDMLSIILGKHAWKILGTPKARMK